MLSRQVEHVRHRLLRLALVWAVIGSVAGTLSFAGASYAAQEIEVGEQARVTNTGGDNIRVREGAGVSFRQVATVREGDLVLVLAGPRADPGGGNWYEVQAARATRATGWVSAEYLDALGTAVRPVEQGATQSTTQGAATIKPGVYVKVANTDGDALRHRTSPSRSAPAMHRIPPSGGPMLVREGPLTDGEGIIWYSVVAANTEGWAMARYLQLAPSPAGSGSRQQGSGEGNPGGTAGGNAEGAGNRGSTSVGDSGAAETGQAVVATAMKYLGARYSFGGSSPSTGFDCSGFVYYVLNSAGEPIARDIVSQLNSGPRVSTSELRPGDLVFFSNTYKPGLSHSGIYVGNGKFINAENERTGVVISELWSSYWASHFTAAVRPSSY